jgi:tRNA pseudouridine38/39 synthase
MLIARHFNLSLRLHRGFTTTLLIRDTNMDKYSNLSREELIARLISLEKPIASSSKLPAVTPPRELTAYERKKAEKYAKANQKFDLTKYPCRKIALRFSYDGASYSGLATQKGKTGIAPPDDMASVITVEDILWKALAETRLVGEDQSMGNVGWSRCGRTDRGVSAGGQVVALWVRSRKVDQWEERRALEQFIVEKKREQGKVVDDEEDEIVGFIAEDSMVQIAESNGHLSDDASHEGSKRVEADPDAEELNYVSTLNAVLPSTIRIQAWSPVRTKFSARFDCRFRHYKYFFTSGCPFIKHTSSRGPVPQLDIPLMQKTAQKFLGDHDFRNFCKVDPSKQIDNYRRRIDGISIDRVSAPWPVARSSSAISNKSSEMTRGEDSETMYVLNLRGTAFLYHQVRHMVAVLFLVGANLEKPSIIDELLNVEKGGLARDRLLMRRRGLILDDQIIPTTLPSSTATTMNGYVASDNMIEDEALLLPSQMNVDELREEERSLLDLEVYDGKPEYKMASDRPLMLWECGFKDSDVQWRSGTYDGPLSPSSTNGKAGDGIAAISGDINSSTGSTIAMLHAHWSSFSITAELYKHFLLALPLDKKDEAGYIPSSLFFDQSSAPSLQKASSKTGSVSSKSPSYARQIVPLGDGHFKPVQNYKGLIKAKREETPDAKNARFLQGRGKRRAERKAAANED